MTVFARGKICRRRRENKASRSTPLSEANQGNKPCDQEDAMASALTSSNSVPAKQIDTQRTRPPRKITDFFHSNASEQPKEHGAQAQVTPPQASKKRPFPGSLEQELVPSSSIVPTSYSSPLVRPPSLLNYRRPVKLARPQRRFEQLFLDLGQQDPMGSSLRPCPECGMVYQRLLKSDEAAHDRFHKQYLKGIQYHKWQDQHIVSTILSNKEYIVLVDYANAPIHQRKKVDDLVDVVNRELGSSEQSLRDLMGMKFYLYIMEGRMIVGFLSCERIQHAYRIHLSNTDVALPSKDMEPERNPCSSSTLSYSGPRLQAICGINRIWCDRRYRQRHIASHLVDAVCESFLFSCPLDRENDLAMSQPTQDGARFAARYFKRPDFLVYTPPARKEKN